MQARQRRRNFWGWGWKHEVINGEVRRQLAIAAATRMGGAEICDIKAPEVDEIDLPEPRVQPPQQLESIFSADGFERASHTYGKAFVDVVKGLTGNFLSAPDLVAYPTSESEAAAILEWASEAGIAVIPYGGGSSVVGGVEARFPVEYRGAVSLDLGRMNRVLEIDRISRSARIEAGVLGPALEDQLRPEGYTLRHFPQSFEFSTLGGWIATRSGGHYATLYTHIDDFVESLRILTPAGTIETRRLPGSGAGPSPDRLFIGSEGTLGIITEAWMRIQDRPVHRATCDVLFNDFRSAVATTRELSQAGLFPTNCRLLDPLEALTAGGDGNTTLLILAFESADSPRDFHMTRALEICRSHGGVFDMETAKSSMNGGTARKGTVGSWRTSFLRAPYIRDALVRSGFIVETFETAITWDRFDEFHNAVTRSAAETAKQVCGHAWVSCRFTHLYPDGPAPYYTVVASSKPGSQISQWREIKAAASDAIISNGGTITHHHAVGRDHGEWYDRQRPELFAAVLRSAKKTLDPSGILNPGVLIDP